MAQQPGILGHAACWAQVRRKFVEATHGRKKTAVAHQRVALIHKLYQVERLTRDTSPEERKATRLEQSEPILFSGSPRGAEASATLYTLVETAKANGLEPWAYLNTLFERLPAAKSEQALLDLLPQNLNMEDLERKG